MTARKSTMSDVARHANVSLKTVSRVVNSEPHVSAEIRQRVHDSINALGFRRNEAAARLARGSGMLTIGLIMENISNEFYSHLAKAVESAAAEHDALVVFGSYTERVERERLLVEAMSARGVDSLIVVPSSADHGWLAEHPGLRTVFVDRAPAGVPDPDVVVIDNLTGGRMATEHLLARGHRRIALLSDQREVSAVHERATGYRQALGPHLDESLVVHGVFDPWRACHEAARLLGSGDPPTAFFATNNRAAVGVLMAGRDLPRRPALVGFDDFALAEVFSPGVSVIRYDFAELARSAVDLLLSGAGTGRLIRVPVELVARGSGELSPADASLRDPA
ncbi:LacI family DNA-binding transcriptional regulator [Nonomuraea soli]|uniref:LacI family transcriptional regulator n=1 Tax=Nonomuraea soli TaxID=1032476 RepID=A0A7W0CPK0_9ACTN|nr:LacI family DNA-binding transcriptional regulator [Nonomuraea soli]MBA2894873.1 LacI family transcriptional regulator [Nonomuraea soli]